MGSFLAGDIVIIPFPYSDLSTSKLRPGLILTDSWPNTYLVAAITSQERHWMRGAIEIQNTDVLDGRLKRRSFIRPEVCFSAKERIIQQKIGRLKPEVHRSIVQELCRIFMEKAPKDSD